MGTSGLQVIVLLLCALVYPPTEACGWNTTALSGTVQSPNFPANYSNRQTCVYVITAPEDYQITINFTDFDLEPHAACTYDFVELRDGDEKSAVIGRYCNTSLPGRKRTFGHQLWLRFVSDISVTRRGFRATFVSENLQAPFFLLTSSIPRSAIGGNIHRMDVETKTNYMIPTSRTLFRPIAVDYDPVNQTIYFTEVGSVRGIRACALNGSGVHTILDAGTSALMDGVAVDPLSRLLVYTDSGRDLIAMMTLSTKAHKTVINSSLDQPRAIVLNTADGVIFWTDWGTPPKIERANYDGSDRRVLVSIGILLINGLALDVANNRLYWVDAATDQVERSDMDGNGRTRLFGLATGLGHHFFSVAVVDSILYFTSWLGGNTANSSVIIRYKEGEINATGYGSTSGRRLNAILAVQPKLFAANNANGCGNNNGGCDVICIPLPSNSSKCACPDGQTLGSDQKTCGSGGSSTPPPPATTPPPTTPMMTAAPTTPSSSSPPPTTPMMTAAPTTPSSSFVVVVTTADTFPQLTCGWNTTALSGTVQSPNFPANYSNRQTCVYVITAPEDYQITINFTDFDLEPHAACTYDFVELRDGDEKSAVIGRYCNTSLPGRKRTFGHQLWLRFVSDGSITRRGFRATFVSENLQAPFFLLTSSIPRSAIGGNIHRMDVETKTNYMIPTSRTLFRPIAVDYDPVNQTIYFTEVGSVRGIRACALNGSGVHTILDAGTSALMDGVAVDPLSRLLVYTDSGRDLIAMMTLSTKAHKTVINSSLDQPRAIVLNTADGVIFWTDWGTPPKIERANYDGSDRRVLVSIGILLINGLALDVANNRLYWVDAATDQVERSDMDGNGRTRLFGLATGLGHHFFSVAVVDSILYFTSWLGGNTANSSVIIRYKEGEINATGYGSTSGRRLNAILAVQPKLFAANNANGCGNNNGGCDVICIPLPSNSSKCACPDGQTLGSDQKTCGSGGSSTPPPPATTPPPTTPMMTAAPTTPSSSFVVVVTTADPQPLDTNGQVDITLTCEASKGIDVTSFAWSVPCTGRAGRTCVFKPRPPEDDGRKVTCTVTSSNGRVGSGELRIQLNYPPQTPPTINGVSKDTVYKQGQSLTLTCSVNGGKPLVASVLFSCGPHLDNAVDIFGTTEVHSVLTIKALSREDDRRLCTCTARWKNTAWYKPSDSVQLRVNGTIPEGPRHDIFAIIAGSAGAGVFIIVVIIIIVVLVRRCGTPKYERPQRKKHSRQENIYSVLGQQTGQRAGVQGQLHSNRAYDGDKSSVYDEAEDNEMNDHYESLDNVAPVVAPNDYLTPVSKPQPEEDKPVPCSWEKQAPEDNYLHPVPDRSEGDPVPSPMPTPN